MSRLTRALDSGEVVLMDGAMGTELFQAGLEEGACAEEWNRTRPRRVRAVHEAYRKAGARCFLTNTFQSNPCSLVRHALEEQVEEINAAAIRLATNAADPTAIVLGDVGVMVSDGQEFPFLDDLARVVESFVWSPGRVVDGLLFETCFSARALSAVEFVRRRVLDNDELPLILSLTYLRRGGRLVTLGGQTPETFARHAAAHGVTVLGVNCGKEMGLDDVIEVVRRYRQVTDLPLLARPNAGTPRREGNNLVYPVDPEVFARGIVELVAAGATLVGGCCGTTPAHIAAASRALGLSPEALPVSGSRA